ncbi:MAG: tRNA (adenosine(37)-N6)-threonylcarbamoyltransferase complex transferase subunit TsaD [Phycisphaerae bacterium]|nr:tRNA (adenosine(37)-N6)-threonylcarbamoyltransferase complex transferase subunit TsaD [Phycisphaerae bacterium]
MPYAAGMLVLGIETSCDETAASVVEWTAGALKVRSNVVASQEALHAPYGGVVPELASRAHLDCIVPTLERALEHAGVGWKDLDRVGVAHCPGLIGSLLVGVSAAKGLAWSLGKPVVPVDHVVAHLAACLLDRPMPAWPALGLVASGGHTSVFRLDGPTEPQLIGWTIDDAIGEAFDKAAAMLGLGYPGGPNIEREAAGGDPQAVRLPSAYLRREGVQFSFSGLKTALLYAARGVPGTPRRPSPQAPPLTPERVRDLAASFQQAAVASIIEGLDAALLHAGERPRSLLVGGGVSANHALRAALEAWSASHGIECRVPIMAHCIDNAAMIAGLAALMPAPSGIGDLGFVAEPMSRIARGARGPQRKAS